MSPVLLLEWRPGPDALVERLERAREQELTGDGGGGLVVEQLTDLGPGDGERVLAALLGWELHRAAGMVLTASTPTVRVGTTVVNAAPFGPIALVAPCRVVALVQRPDAHGFTYATLPGHPLVGSETFTVEQADGRAQLRIRSQSRVTGPARLLPPLARAGQRHVNRRYAAAARRVVA